MATKKEINELLKKLQLKESDMDTYWDELLETNFKAKAISGCGKTWRDLHISLIEQLPTQKQKDVEAAETKRRTEEEKAQAELKAKQDKAYYNEHFDEIILNKIDSGEELTEKEIKRLVYEYNIESNYGDNRRWTRSVSTIIKLGERTFLIEWEEGLTESQENEFYNQPYEVKKNTYEKTVTVVEWVKLA